jgi:hypothetical protein
MHLGQNFSRTFANSQEAPNAVLDCNREAFFDRAFRAFKGAKIEARLTRFDPSQPHRLAALRAWQNANLRK